MSLQMALDYLAAQYGQLHEAIFVEAYPRFHYILVFSEGVQLDSLFDVDWDTQVSKVDTLVQKTAGLIGGFKFGYAGTGPDAFSAFLKLANFVDTDIDSDDLMLPMKLQKDGTRLPGKIVRNRESGDRVEWEDGSYTPLFLTLDAGRVEREQREEAIQLQVQDLLKKLDTGDLGSLLETLRRVDPPIRGRVIKGLGATRDARAVRPILQVLGEAFRNGDRKTADGSTAALQAIGASEPDALIVGLSDNTTEVRWTIAGLLGDLGGRRAIPALREALDDPDEGVREAATVGLERIESR